MAKACSSLKDIFLYTDTTGNAGLVQQPDKIVVRCAHTIYPYSFWRKATEQGAGRSQRRDSRRRSRRERPGSATQKASLSLSV